MGKRVKEISKKKCVYLCRSELYFSFCPASFEVGKYRVTINLFIKEIIVTSPRWLNATLSSWQQREFNANISYMGANLDVRHCGDARLQTSISAEFRGVYAVCHI